MIKFMALAIALCGILLIPTTIFAEGEGRYEATRILSKQDEQCVLILDTKVGYVWTWERKKIDGKLSTTLRYWGMVEIGKKIGDVIDTTRPEGLSSVHPSN